MAADDKERELILEKLGAFKKEGEALVNSENGELLDDQEEIRPEDEIPDLPENQSARDFLKNAPSKGLWLPMGVEVKVMQCWRCKAYGHRTNDRECPLSKQGNLVLDSERQAREDPMCVFVAKKLEDRREKYERVKQLMSIMEDIRKEERERLKKKRKHKDKKHKKKNKRSKET